jgi:WD40 repeat protein
VEVCSLLADKQYDHLIVSGSSDTNAKVWDLRTKNCQHNIKNHNKKITALAIGKESRILATGGEDGVVQTFDLKMMKPIFQYELDSPVLSLDMNARNFLAVGCMDRVARVYEVSHPFRQVGSTKNETMPVSSVVFYQEEHLLTGGTDHLKVWDVGQDLMLTDNIETSSKGILHMVVEDKIQQIAFSGGSLTYHQCHLSEVNFDGPYVYSNHSISHDKFEKVEEALQKNNKIRRGNTINNPLLHITNEKTKLMLANRNDSVHKQLSGVADNISDALSNIKKASEEFTNRRA